MLKKSGSQKHTIKKKRDPIIDLNINNNNIKVVKFDEEYKSTTTKKNNSANKNCSNNQKVLHLVFNDLKSIKPEYTLVIHDIDSDFVNTNEFKRL